MKLPRRKFLYLAAGAAILPALPRVARGQAYPARPVRIIVAFPPGGAATVLAELISPWLSERLGQSFVVEHQPGASTNIGTEAVVHAPADGYTLLLASATNAINATLYNKLSFNFVRDLAPVAGLTRTPSVMVVSPSFQAKTVPEFIAYTKSNPGKVSYAGAGNGTLPHVVGELFKMMAGVELALISYPGMEPALASMIAGRVDVAFAPLPVAISYIRAGTLRPLAVTAARRVAVLADVPTVSEFVPGFEASGFQGIVAPRNTPAEVVERLNSEINTGLADPKLKAKLEQGGTTLPGSPADFGKFIVDEKEKWATVIRAANIKAE